jgi:23S rRNA (uracil1939-C5)-methyltransferase
MQEVKLKQGDKITVAINNLGTNGEGVGVYQDYTVFVPFVLQGEEALCRVDYVKRNVCYATVLQIVSPSPSRVAPQCKYYGKCGGCALQHAHFDVENSFKQALVQSNLRKLGKVDCLVNPTVSCNRFGYRNKISLPVSGKAGNVKIGMYKRGSHDVVQIDECLLTASWANDLIAIVTQYLNQVKAVPYNQLTFKGEVRHVTARYVNNQLLVTLVTNGAYKRNLQPLIDLLKDSFKQFGLFINVNTSKNNVILGKVTNHVYGIKQIVGCENGITFHVQPDSFFQVNDKVKRLMYDDVKRLVNSSKPDVLIECFSGVGLLTAELVSPNYDVIAMEIVPSAVADADQMKHANNIKRLTNLCGDVNDLLPQVMDSLQGKSTVMVVDPPRKGLGENICNLILNNPPQQVVYVSCDSATLARDVGWLSQKYNVTYVQPYNMFPSTNQVETIVCLTNKN